MSSWNSTSGVTDIRPRHRAFHFVSATLVERQVVLRYALEGGPDPDLAFCERLDLPDSLPAPDPDDPAVVALLRACHLCFGVSYYKAALPSTIVVADLDAREAAFWDLLYSEGLGEFYFRNQLPMPAQPGFLAAADGPSGSPPQTATEWPERALVLIGGGKDSALVADIVRASGVAAEALSLGYSPWMERSAHAAGLRLHAIRRRIDPALLELNARGAWNGHVPISACIAAVAMLVAYAGRFTDVLVGNERGADDANVVWQGRAVNHQWSKSSRFERAFQAWCSEHVGSPPRYASLLRPLSEIRIAERFANCTAQHAEFTSCNRNFRQDPTQRPSRWCGKCAKCTFVALILAPHLDNAAALAIFGQDILGAAHNKAHLETLLALRDIKPWDCVGTARECWLSLLALHRQGRLPPQLDDLVTRAPADLQGKLFKAAWDAERSLHATETLPARWRTRLEAYLAAE